MPFGATLKEVGRELAVLQSDRGREFCKHCEEDGIPQIHRVEGARTLLDGPKKS